MKRLYATLLLLAALSISVSAQFVTGGNDPSSVKWKYIETGNYRIVYPGQMDSLAREYARSLEGFREAVGGSIGMMPNEFYKKKMPVVLHAFTAESNGSVAWAPRIMDLYTNPEAYNPDPNPWIEQLTVHENRHVAQMQFGKANGRFCLLNDLLGQIWTGAASGIFPGPAILEGDAVVAETALTRSGRGRTADFLEYYRVSLADSLHRNYWQWRWGSQKRYTPNHYANGYMLISGMRVFYDIPDFTKRYFDGLGWRLFNLQKTVKQASGEGLVRTFDDIQRKYAEYWAGEEKGRAPFTEGSDVTTPRRLYDSYGSLVFAGDSLFALHSGLDRNSEIVLIDSLGRCRHVKYVPGGVSRLSWDESGKRLLWSEYRAGRRWGLESTSIIKSMKAGKTLSIKGRKYYNPSPSQEEGGICAVRYADAGQNYVVLLDGDGAERTTLRAPDGIQPLEPVWVDGRLFVNAITADGMGIYEPLAAWRPVLEPAFVKMSKLFARDGRIWFTSDLNGVNNLYSTDPSGQLLQHTSTRFGGTSFAFSPEGALYYCAPTPEGRVVRRLDPGQILSREVEYKAAEWAIADKMSAQEHVPPSEYDGEISDPEPYGKTRNLIRFHSWAPISLNYDFAERLSLEETSDDGGLGATAFFQNDLGTAYGLVSVGFTSPADTLGTGGSEALEFRTNAHMQFIYTGLPVAMEFRADFGERNAHIHDIDVATEDGKSYSFSPFSYKGDSNYMSFSVNAYLPLNLSGGGWSRGIIPSVKATFDNDEYTVAEFSGRGVVKSKSPSVALQASVRAYSNLPVTSSRIYPLWGIGGEAGLADCGNISTSFPITGWCSRYYGKVYGYLPGLLSTHGLRLEADFEQGYGSAFANLATAKLKADYAFPLLPVDWSGLSPFAYVRNFEAILHGRFENTSLAYKVKGPEDVSKNSWSLGATLQLRLSNLAWIPYDTRIGLKVMYDSITGVSVGPSASTDLF